MAEGLRPLRACWYQGVEALLRGDEASAQEIWLSAMLACQADEVTERTRELVRVLESTVIELLQVGNLDGAKQCYDMIFEVDSTFKNPTLDRVLRWREWYVQECEGKGYRFTTDWFSGHIPIWHQALRRFVDLPDLQFLEVGSWEGRSTCWLLDNVLTDPSSRMTCIDTFEGSIEHHSMGWEDQLRSLEAIFDHNIQQTGRGNQVTKLKGISQSILRQLPTNTFDFYYIDGSHIAADILLDTMLGWDLLKPGGVIIFDDYGWKLYRDQPTLHPKLAVDSFMAVFQDRINILYRGYQVICEKVS